MANRLTADEAFEISLEADDVEFYENYSGRFMYGKEVPAFVVEDIARGLIEITRAAQALDIDLDRLPERTDNLGRRYIIY